MIRRLAFMARRDSKGSTTVEFAMVILPFIYMALAAIDIVLMFSAWSTVQWACNTAARQSMVAARPTAAAARTAASTAAIAAGFSSGGTSTIDFSGTAMTACGTLANCVLVKGSYVYNFKLTTMGRFSVTLKAQAMAPNFN